MKKENQFIFLWVFVKGFKMQKHLKNIDLRKYDQAVKFLTRPFENKLSLDQSIAISTLIDRVNYFKEEISILKLTISNNKLKAELALLEAEKWISETNDNPTPTVTDLRFKEYDQMYQQIKKGVEEKSKRFKNG